MQQCNIVMKSGLVLMLYDNFTGKPIQIDNIRITTDKIIKIVRKNNSCFAFMTNSEKTFKVIIESKMYCKQELDIDLESNVESRILRKIHLIPNKCCMRYEDMICIDGIMAQNSSIYVACKDINTQLKLLNNYKKKENMLSIYNPAKIELEGKMIKLEDLDKGNSEYVTLGHENYDQQGEYGLSEPLKNNYNSNTTKVYLVYIGKSDEKGEFFVAVKNIEKSDCSVSYMLDGKKEKIINVFYGKRNKFDFTK